MKAYLMMGAAVVIFSAGWTVKNWQVKAALNAAKDKVRAEELVKINQLRDDLGALEVDMAVEKAANITLTAEIAAEKQNVKIKYRTIQNEVPIYVPSNSEKCNYDLDAGLVRLINLAAIGEDINDSYMSDNSLPNKSPNNLP